MRQIYKFYDLGAPGTVTIDKCDALITALKVVFPQVPRLICVWHINKNVEAHARKLFKAKIIESEGENVAPERASTLVSRQLDSFRQGWHSVLYATSIPDFDRA